MSPQPTKTVSVQIKLDLRRPGTFNYPKYHQRRCHDLTSVRINGVLTKCLPLSVNWASSRSVWKGAAGGLLHHCLGLSHCTCHRYDAITLKNRMTEMLGKFSHLLMSAGSAVTGEGICWQCGRIPLPDILSKANRHKYNFKDWHWLIRKISLLVVLNKSPKSQWHEADKLNPPLIIFMHWSVAVTVADFASQQWHCVLYLWQG